MESEHRGALDRLSKHLNTCRSGRALFGHLFPNREQKVRGALLVITVHFLGLSKNGERIRNQGVEEP